MRLTRATMAARSTPHTRRPYLHYISIQKYTHAEQRNSHVSDIFEIAEDECFVGIEPTLKKRVILQSNWRIVRDMTLHVPAIVAGAQYMRAFESIPR